jgi:putative flippase GtrA
MTRGAIDNAIRVAVGSMKNSFARRKQNSPLWQRLAVAFVLLVLIFFLLFLALFLLISRDLFISILLSLAGGIAMAGAATYNGWRASR